MSASNQSLYTLFVDELRCIYAAETQSLDIWPRIAAAATDADLRNTFDEHIGKTHRHVERLNTIFDEISLPAGGPGCAAMSGLAQEAERAISAYEDTDVRDAALIVAVQKMEHYEIASYGSLRTFAKALALPNAEELLGETVSEEGELDKALTGLAEGGFFSKGLNREAI